MSRYNSKNDILSVAMIDITCPICGNKVDNEIVINKRLTHKASNEVKNLNGKSFVGNVACEDCLKYKDEALFVIEIDVDKSDDKSYYRTGNVYGLRKSEKVVNMFGKYIITTNNGVSYVFVDYRETKRIGISSNVNSYENN